MNQNSGLKCGDGTTLGAGVGPTGFFATTMSGGLRVLSRPMRRSARLCGPLKRECSNSGGCLTCCSVASMMPYRAADQLEVVLASLSASRAPSILTWVRKSLRTVLFQPGLSYVDEQAIALPLAFAA
jgi:hypothetical protein